MENFITQTLQYMPYFVAFVLPQCIKFDDQVIELNNKNYVHTVWCRRKLKTLFTRTTIRNIQSHSSMKE